MFLDQYKLESNPFAPKQVRPRLQSTSCRSAFVKLGRVVDRSLHCLFLSGRAGVGKSTLVERHFKDLTGVTVSLIGPGTLDGEHFLRKVLRDTGLPEIECGVGELRNILEVYLRHQSSKGHRIVLVADALERLAESVLTELETLMELRYKGRPLLGFVLLTRSEELVHELMPLNGGSPFAPYAHERLTGFSFDELGTYIGACLQSMGCDAFDTLFPERVIADIYAYTGGVVGDINALCCEALNVLAEEPPSEDRPVLNSALIARAGEALNLRYDASFWHNVEDSLSPESIQESDPGELKLEAAHLLVTSRGKAIAEIALNRPRMVLGRDQSCDISLDSSYVSRYQNLFMETDGGWMLIDLSSTNGCFVNGRRVSHHELQDGDVIAVGHHQISFVGPGGRRAPARSKIKAGVDHPDADETAISPNPISHVESA